MRVTRMLGCLAILALGATALPAQADVTVPEGDATVDRITVTFDADSLDATGVAEADIADGTLDDITSRTSDRIADALDSAGVEAVAADANAGGAMTLTLSEPLTESAAADLMEGLGDIPTVATAEPDVWFTAAGAGTQPTTPSDEFFPLQWNLTGAYGIRAPKAWVSSIGSGVNVAVIDTGITAHPDLQRNVVAGYDMISSIERARDGNGRDANPTDVGDWIPAGQCMEPVEVASSWHGTHVAGIVGALGNNGQGISGVAPGVRIQPVRVLGRCGAAGSDVADAITWASGGEVPGLPRNSTPSRILNLSLGGDTGPCPAVLQAAIENARARGAIPVVASGNAGAAVTSTIARCLGVVVVGATTKAGALAPYSDSGPQVTVMAPGGTETSGVMSTFNLGSRTVSTPSYAFGAGTSEAAPHVSGVLALILARRPDLTPDLAVQAMLTGARPVPNCTVCGAGIVDAAAALTDADAVPRQPVVNIYATPGEHVQGGRLWRTTCEPYSQTSRCRTEIYGTSVVYASGQYKSQTGWMFNNLTYLPMSSAQWGRNPLARTGTFTQGGRQWKSECRSALTGPKACRSSIWATVIAPSLDSSGTRRYRNVSQWVLNNIVMFTD